MNIFKFFVYWIRHRNDSLDELNSHGCTLDEYAIVKNSFIRSWKNHKILERNLRKTITNSLYGKFGERK